MTKKKKKTKKTPVTENPITKTTVTAAPPKNLFFTLLNRAVRSKIYSYLALPAMLDPSTPVAFPKRRESICDSLGLALSCRQAYAEIQHEGARELWLWVKKLEAEAAEHGYVSRVPKSLTSKESLIGLRNLTVTMTSFRTPLFAGALYLNTKEYKKSEYFQELLFTLKLDRLEIRVLENPMDLLWKRPAFPLSEVSRYFIMWEACTVLTDGYFHQPWNMKEFVISWDCSDSASTTPNSRLLHGRELWMKKSNANYWKKKMRLPLSYKMPKFAYAITETGDAGMIVMRSETRWKPVISWVHCFLYKCLHEYLNDEGEAESGHHLPFRRKATVLKIEGNQD